MKRATAGLLLAVAAMLPAQQQREKAASGEYLSWEAFGEGDNSDALETREEWILWRLPDGGFQVEGKRSLRWARENVRRENFLDVLLSDALAPVRALRLGWYNDLNTCDFEPKLFRCRAGDEQRQVAVEAPYSLYDTSPWFLGNAVRHAVREVERRTPVRLVLIDEPFGVGAFRASVEYLGEEEGTHWYALDAGDFGRKRIRVAPEGIVLSVENLSNKVRMELVRYDKFGGFGAQPR